jgi:hypothetical protein
MSCNHKNRKWIFCLLFRFFCERSSYRLHPHMHVESLPENQSVIKQKRFVLVFDFFGQEAFCAYKCSQLWAQLCSRDCSSTTRGTTPSTDYLQFLSRAVTSFLFSRHCCCHSNLLLHSRCPHSTEYLMNKMDETRVKWLVLNTSIVSEVCVQSPTSFHRQYPSGYVPYRHEIQTYTECAANRKTGLDFKWKAFTLWWVCVYVWITKYCLKATGIGKGRIGNWIATRNNVPFIGYIHRKCIWRARFSATKHWPLFTHCLLLAQKRRSNKFVPNKVHKKIFSSKLIIISLNKLLFWHVSIYKSGLGSGIWKMNVTKVGDSLTNNFAGKKVS